MYEIRILVLVDARSREVNNAVGLIHILHLAHKPVALGNLARLCHAALLVGAHVIEVDVVPVVALRDPKHLLAIVDKLAPQAIIVDERFGALLHNGAESARIGIHGQHLIELVPTLVILHGHLAAIGRPPEPVELILVFDGARVAFHLLHSHAINKASLRILGQCDRIGNRKGEDHRPVLRQFVARLGIFLLVEIRLLLVSGRRLYIVDVTLLNLVALANEDLA